MDLKESLSTLKTFTSNDFGLDQSRVKRSAILGREKNILFLGEFKCYIDQYTPIEVQCFTYVGNPIELYSQDKLSRFWEGTILIQSFASRLMTRIRHVFFVCR